MEIKKVNNEEASKIINSMDQEGKYTNLGKFYTQEDSLFIGMDNSDGNCWVEEFDTEEKCLAWLRGEFDIGDEEGDYIIVDSK